MPLYGQLTLRGYDVYITNNSGVQYSQEHDIYNKFSKEFWDMDYTKYGKYDFPAFTRAVQERNGGAKVAMIGHSQGTTQTFAGMAEIPEWYDYNVSVAILMGPCSYPTVTFLEPLYNKENWDCLAENEIYAFAGPSWYIRDKWKIIENCPGLVDSIDSFEGLPNNPVKAVAAYSQTAYA